MKKKIIMMMVALTVVTSVTACGPQNKAENSRKAKTEESAKRGSEEKGSAKRESKENERDDVEKPEETETESKEFSKRLEQVDVVSFEGKHILLNVPKSYNWNIENEENEGGCFFDREDGKETVFVGFWDRYVELDETYCDEELQIPDDATGTESEVMTEEINGRTVYYKHISYEYEEYNGMVYYETVKAMCEVGDRMLVVETSGLSGEEADFEEIRGFFEFDEK